MTAPARRVVAADLPRLLDRVRGALDAAREEVDSLNVFPVPDGDTGTNLVSTVQSAVATLTAVAPEDPVEEAARAASLGALRGAAGNSGVIFSQVVRSLAEALAEGEGELTVRRLGAVLDRARTLSYEAVAEPLAGTILTAMDAAADAIADVPDGTELAEALRVVLDAVGQAVAASREILRANREAGVVDAGARGFEVAIDGLLAFVEGRTFAEVAPPPIRRTRGDLVHRESGSLAYACEVQYLLEAEDEVAGPLREGLEQVGDSVVVVACGGLLNVHVHTNQVDEAVAVGRAHGDPSRVEVTAFEDAGEPAPHEASTPAPAVREKVGFLAVVPGPGAAELVRAAGAVPVEGRAGALPTVATVLNVVGTVSADEVVLLPGNPNVVPTMRHASAVSVAEGGRSLHVVDEADSLPAVLAVLVVGSSDELDPDAWAGAASHVRAGEVVSAIRDAQTPLGPVRDGQQLAVVGGVVVAAEDSMVAAVAAVVEAIVDDEVELLTLVAGAEVDDDERQRVVKRVEDLAPHVEVEVLEGGQRPARWILGAE